MGRAPRLYALLGSPVDHSLSPEIHAAAFRHLGEQAVYGVVETEVGEVETLMRALARRGGGNVTLPHKEGAARAVARASPAVEATGACNCFWSEEGRLHGDNTDVEGFLRSLRGLIPGDGPAAGVPPEPGAGHVGGRTVLLLGAGGGARAVLHALLREEAGRVDVWNRTRRRAVRMREEVTGDDARVRVLDARQEVGDRYDLVVNATRLGMEPDDPLPLDLEGREVGAAFDLVYGASGTPWTRHSRRLGVPARDGLEMLVRQAAVSLERWLGRDAPVDVMREAARRQLDREAPE